MNFFCRTGFKVLVHNFFLTFFWDGTITFYPFSFSSFLGGTISLYPIPMTGKFGDILLSIFLLKVVLHPTDILSLLSEPNYQSNIVIVI